MEHPQSFIRRYVFSTDHKVIGIQYIVTGLVMAGVGALLAVMIRLQLGWPTVPKEWLGAMFPQGMPGGIMTPEFYLALVTMHGTIMVFFFISYVLVSGFGNYLIPLQIGARDMAFPFLNMLSYWIALLSAAVMLLSFLVEGGAAAAALLRVLDVRVPAVCRCAERRHFDVGPDPRGRAAYLLGELHLEPVRWPRGGRRRALRWAPPPTRHR